MPEEEVSVDATDTTDEVIEATSDEPEIAEDATEEEVSI